MKHVEGVDFVLMGSLGVWVQLVTANNHSVFKAECKSECKAFIYLLLYYFWKN